MIHCIIFNKLFNAKKENESRQLVAVVPCSTGRKKETDLKVPTNQLVSLKTSEIDFFKLWMFEISHIVMFKQCFGVGVILVYIIEIAHFCLVKLNSTGKRASTQYT